MRYREKYFLQRLFWFFKVTSIYKKEGGGLLKIFHDYLARYLNATCVSQRKDKRPSMMSAYNTPQPPTGRTINKGYLA